MISIIIDKIILSFFLSLLVIIITKSTIIGGNQHRKKSACIALFTLSLIPVSVIIIVAGREDIENVNKGISENLNKKLNIKSTTLII